MDFAEFARDREPLLREFLRLENGLPSHDTFSRVFRLLEPEAFGRAFGAFLCDLGADGAGVLAIDGKTLRRSFDRAAGRSALQVVTAFGADARISLGQRAVASGENEITAARALLATLALDGALVTGDAIHAQSETAQLVLDRGGDYLFALKANRPAMLEAVAAFFADPRRQGQKARHPGHEVREGGVSPLFPSLGNRGGSADFHLILCREPKSITTCTTARSSSMSSRPPRNMRRFHRLSVQRDLFGRASLVREWARIGFRGQMMVESHTDEGKAVTALMKLAAVKKRRGYEDLPSGDWS